MRSIAIINQKGGVGKTTTAVNLSAALARAGQRVGLIDIDPQAHASLHLGLDPQAKRADRVRRAHRRNADERIVAASRSSRLSALGSQQNVSPTADSHSRQPKRISSSPHRTSTWPPPKSSWPAWWAAK